MIGRARARWEDESKHPAHNGRKRPIGQELEDALERSMPPYSPEHRRAVMKGMRILARVAIRSYMDNGDGEERD